MYALSPIELMNLENRDFQHLEKEDEIHRIFLVNLSIKRKGNKNLQFLGKKKKNDKRVEKMNHWQVDLTFGEPIE